jgi:hypothetical protein
LELRDPVSLEVVAPSRMDPRVDAEEKLTAFTRA